MNIFSEVVVNGFGESLGQFREIFAFTDKRPACFSESVVINFLEELCQGFSVHRCIIHGYLGCFNDQRVAFQSSVFNNESENLFDFFKGTGMESLTHPFTLDCK